METLGIIKACKKCEKPTAGLLENDNEDWICPECSGEVFTRSEEQDKRMSEGIARVQRIFKENEWKFGNKR